VTEADVLEQIQHIAATEFGLTRRLTLDDDLFRDLDLDSVQLITLAIALEQRLQVVLPPADTTRVRTIGELCWFIVSEGQARP
jgi:acyl carrier protein